MADLAVSIAAALMRACQWTPLRGKGADYGANPDQASLSDPRQRYRQGYTEAARVDDFHRIFPELRRELPGKDVLDFGCGYGGKTVEYAKTANFVAGVEPLPVHIELANGFARHLGVGNVEFRVCSQDTIPYPDESFDIVLSHDVLEHVANPRISLAEIHRVLRPGGKAYVVFPPYDGMISHHLEYECLLPGLHWLFSADTLIKAVNRRLLATGSPMHQQPAPRLGYAGKRKVLPQLNGLTSAEFEEMARAFAGNRTRFHLVGWDRGGMVGAVHDYVLRPLAAMGLRERVAFSVVAVLTKAHGSSSGFVRERAVASCVNTSTRASCAAVSASISAG